MGTMSPKTVIVVLCVLLYFASTVHVEAVSVSEISCDTLLLDGQTVSTDALPYRVDLSALPRDVNDNFAYKPRKTYELKLVSTDEQALEGFMLQGRKVDGETPAGSFMITDHGNTEIGHCPKQSSLVSSPENFQFQHSISVFWTAPLAGTGTVKIHFTVIQSSQPVNYWGNEQTQVIMEDNSLPFTKYELVTPMAMTVEDDPTAIRLTVSTEQAGMYELRLNLNTVTMPQVPQYMYQDPQGGFIQQQMEFPNCLYQGTVEGRAGWDAAISTCGGHYEGDFGDFGEKRNLFHLEPRNRSNPMDQTHYFYRDSDIKNDTGTCGTHGHEKGDMTIPPPMNSDSGNSGRRRRQAETAMRMVEWVVVNDHAQFMAFGEDHNAVLLRAMSIANGVDMAYQQLNIRVVLIEVITFSEMDLFNVTSDLIVLNHFTAWARDTHDMTAYDSMMLMTGIDLQGSVIGVAFVGTMCNRDLSFGVTQDGAATLSVVTAIAAHELGHIFNMQHDDPTCSCPDTNCIMGASLSFPPPTNFSDCSAAYLQELIDEGGDVCLFNPPGVAAECGNGFLELGEECDCVAGGPCTDPCCNDNCVVELTVDCIIDDHLLPYGELFGDQMTPSFDDGHSGIISKPTSCPFFGTSEDTIYVNTNGLISFRSSYTIPIPRPFPISDRILIAPFWDDVDLSRNGRLFYRFSTDQTLLDEVGGNVSAAFEVSFTPSSLFIVTWDEAARFGGSLSMLNTFQAVIATDGNSTYVLFLYRDIQWGDAGTSVGFNAGDGVRGFNVPEAFGDFDILSLESTSNVGLEYPGVHMYRVDQSGVIQPIAARVECEPLTSPANGRVSLTDITVGGVATYTCASEYLLEGPRIRVCEFSGNWTDTEPYCRARANCGALENPMNGFINSTGILEGDVAIYTCEPTFILEGPSRRYCLINETWTGFQPYCRAQSVCGSLSPPANGNVNVTGITEGSVANYSCSPGLKHVGPVIRFCLINGNWSGEDPVCEDDHLLPFGEIFGDVMVPPDLDASSAAISKLNLTGSTCRVFGVEEDTLYITSNGVLSFRHSFPDFTPEPFPLEFSSNSNIEVLISPFWDDTNYGQGGSVLYRFTTSPNILEEIGTNITNAFGINFDPVIVFIVTWDRLPEYQGPSDVVNTFQAVLTTDGFQTYVMFLYRDIQWGSSNTTVGFNAGDGIRGYNLPEASTTAGILNLESTSNHVTAGAYYFRVDNAVIEPSTVLAECGSPPDLADGQVLFTATNEGSIAIYVCNEGYELEGPNNRTCLSSGIWSNTEQICTGVTPTMPTIATLTTPGSITTPTSAFPTTPTSTLPTTPSSPSSTTPTFGTAPTSPPTEDFTVIEFDKTLYEVYEDIGKTDLAVRVCINIFNLTSERTIRIMTASGTAVGGEDYEELSVEVPIRFGVTRKCVGISILEDSKVEENEMFQVVIEELGISTQVAILDDDFLFDFVDDTPYVRGRNVTFNLNFGQSVIDARCAMLPGRRHIRNCISGTFSYVLPSRIGLFTPRIEITQANGTKTFFIESKRSLRLGVNNRCGLHLTNYGVAVVPNSAGVMVNVISWGLSGPAGIEEELTNFRCRLDGQNTHICQSPYMTESLSPGEHSLRVWSRDNPACRANLRRTFRFTAP